MHATDQVPQAAQSAAGCAGAWSQHGVQAWLPDSPRWLLFSGAPRDQVFQALSRCKGQHCDDEWTAEELRTMQASSDEAPKSEGGTPAFLWPPPPGAACSADGEGDTSACACACLPAQLSS